MDIKIGDTVILKKAVWSRSTLRIKVAKEGAKCIVLSVYRESSRIAIKNKDGDLLFARIENVEVV